MIHLRRNPDLTVILVDGEAVLINTHTHLTGLGEVSSRIWQHLETPLTRVQLFTALEGDYWVSRAECERLANPILMGLLSREIVLEVRIPD